MRRISCFLALTVLAGYSIAGSSLHAAALTWDLSTSASFQGGNGTWSASSGSWGSTGTSIGNWVAGDDAVFFNANGVASAIAVSGSQSVGNMTFSTTGYTISSGTLGFTATGGTITANQVATINTTLNGAGGLYKTGAATLTLGGNNTYSGTTTITGGGAITVNSNTALGSSSLLINSALDDQLFLGSGVTISNSATLAGGSQSGQGVIDVPTGNATYAGAIKITGAANAGGQFASGTGTLTLSGPITSASVTPVVRTGVVVFANSSSSFSALSVSGTAQLGITNGIASGAAVDLGISANAVLDLAGFNQTLSQITKDASAGIVGNSSTTSDSTLTLTGSSGSGVVIQDDVGAGTHKVNLAISGSTTLTGLDTYSGTTTLLNGGVLNVGNASGLVTLVGNISGTGNVVKSAAGQWTVSGSNSYTGTTNIKAGTMQFANENALYGDNTANWTAANITVASGAVLALNVGGPDEFTASDVQLLSALGTSTSGFTNGSSLGLDTTNAGGGTFVYSNAINNTSGGANALGLVKLGPNILSLATSNSYTGGTTIAGGELSVVDPNAIPAGTAIVFTGGTLQHTATNLNDFSTAFRNSSSAIAIDTNGLALTYAGVIAASNSGGFTKTGAGTLTLAAANLYLGTTTVSGGILQAGSAPSPFSTGGLAVGAAGTVDLNGNNISVGPLSGAGGGILTDMSASSGTTTLTVNQGGTASTYSATIQDGGVRPIALVKTGSGNLTLANANFYSGGTFITGATTGAGPNNGITILNSQALGTGPIFVGDQVTNNEPSLTLGNGVNLSGNALTLASSTATAGRGYLATAASSAASYSGPLTLAGDGATGIFNNGTLNVYGTINGTGSSFQLRGTGTGFMQSTINVGAEPVNKTDAGSWTINSTGNTWGTTTVAVGTLIVGANNALPTTTVLTMGQGDANSSTLNLSGNNQSIAGLLFASTGGTKTITNSTAFLSTLTITPSTSYNYGGVISGPVAVVIAGTGTGSQTFSGTGNTFTGGVDVQSGTLVIGNASAFNAANGGMAVDGGTLDLAGNNVTVGALSGIAGVITNSSSTAIVSITTSSSLSSTFNGSLLNGTGVGIGLTKAGIGTLTLAGSNNYSGSTNINGGVLIFASSSALPSITGSIFINNGGALAVTGPYTTVAAWQSSNEISTSSLGALALVGNSSENINMASYSGLSLGNTGSIIYSGTLTPPANTYRFGGAGGTMSITSPLNQGNTLVIAGGGSPGFVILTNTGDNTFVGGITIASGGTLQGSTETMQGNTANNGAMIFDQVDAGTFASSISGSGTIVKQNVGSVNLTGNSSTFTGAASVTSGTLSVDPAGSLAFSSGFTVNGAGSVLNVGGVLSRTTGAGSLTIDNGAVANFSGTESLGGSNGAVIVGNTSSGTLNVTSGALTLNPTGGNGFGIGYTGGGSGLLNITGGTVTTGSNDVFLVGYGNTLSTGTVNVSGNGVLTLGASSQTFIGGGASASGQYGTGVMTVGGSALVTVGASSGVVPNDKLYLGGYGGTGTLYLNGGTLATSRGLGTATSGSIATLYLNGGVLRANTTFANLIAVSNTYVQSGGALIDTQANAVTISQLLKHDPALGATPDGGLLKLGAGTLTLSPASPNTYTGGTVVNQGALVLTFGDNNNNLGTIAGPVTINPGATLRVTTTKGIGFAYSATGNVTTVTDNLGLLDYTGTNGGLGGGQTVYLTGGTIQSNLGVSSASATGFYRFTTNGIVDNTIYTLASTASSLISGRVEADAAAAFNVSRGSAAVDLIVSAALTGATGPMVKSGAGIMLLSGAGTYTGGTDIQAGTVQLGNANGLGANTNALAVDGGTLDLKGVSATVGALSGSGGTILNSTAGAVSFTTSSTSAATFSGQLTNGGGTLNLVKAGSGLELLNGSNSFSGTTGIIAGTLQYSSTAALGNGGAASITVSPGGVAAAGYAIDQNFLGHISPASSGVVALAANSANNLDFSSTGANLPSVSLGAVGAQTFSGTIVPNGASYRLGGAGGILTVIPSLSDVGGPTSLIANPNSPVGMVILTNPDSYSGGTTVAGGTLQFNSLAAFGTAPAPNTSVASGAVVAAGYAIDQTFLSQINPTSSGAIALAANSANNLDFSSTGANLAFMSLGAIGAQTFSGTFVPNGTTYRFGGASGTLTVASSLGDVAGSTSLIVNPNSSPGTIALSGINTYSGGTTISAGLLQLAGPSALPANSTLTMSAGTLDVNGNNATVSVLTATGSSVILSNNTVNPGTFTFNPVSGATTYSGLLANGAGTLALNMTGPGLLNLPTANTYTGGTTISAGTLQAGSTTAFGPATGASLTYGANSTGDVQLNGKSMSIVGLSSNAAVGTPILENASATSGTLTVNLPSGVADTYAGVIQNGSGAGSLTLIIGGSAPINNGDGGSLTLSGNNTFTGNVTMSGGNTAASGTLILTSSGALGVGPKTVTATGGGTIHLQNNITLANNINFTTSGNDGIGAQNTTSASSTNFTSGNTGVIVNDSGNNVINGNFTLTSGNGSTSFLSNNGNLTVNGTISDNTSGRALNLWGNGNGTINGLIFNGTAGLSLVKTVGTGTWTISDPANTYSGTTTVAGGGILNVASLANGGSASAIGSSPNTAGNLIFGGATLQYTGSTAQTTDHLFTINAAGGAIDSSGSSGASLTFNNPGQVISADAPAATGGFDAGLNLINVGNTQSLAVGMTVSGSGVQPGTTITGILGASRIAISGSTTFTGTSTLSFGITNRVFTLTGSDADANTLGAALANSSGGGKLSLAKTGPGFWSITGANTYSGGTYVGAGTLQLGNASALGSSAGGLTANAGVLDLASYSPTVASLSGSAGFITNSAANAVTLNVSGTSATTFGGTLSDGAGQTTLILSSSNGAGMLTLSGTNSYSGGTTVLSGALILDGASSLLAGSTLTIGAPSPGAVFTAPLAVSPQSTSVVAPVLAPVPEPGTFVMLAIAAFVGLGIYRRRWAA